MSDGKAENNTPTAMVPHGQVKSKPATELTAARNKAVLGQLPFEDKADFTEAARGFVAALPNGTVLNANARPLWDLNEYEFLKSEDAPPSVNPSLWRQARLNLLNGLFKVCDRVYQIRGFDIANMTIIEGDTGLILIDPLTTCEVAKAGLELYWATFGKRPVRAVIYSHSHTDHYGGVKGVTSDADVAAGKVAIIAPDGFMEAVSGENVLAGNAMIRRALFQFGNMLHKGIFGQVDAGLGKGIARGTASLIPPTDLIKRDIDERVIDGIRIEFQLAPDSEAPAEMHMFLPQFNVLNMAENATRNLHNFCPIRGAVVRDPRVWSRYLADAIDIFGPRTDILIGQHHWPTWGRETIIAFLAKQRDLYKFVHDQALRLANHGFLPNEISEVLELPPELAKEWSLRGYYGTLSHNSKAVYQRYLSWYDGNPANLNPLTARAAGKKYVDYMGGAASAIAKAREDFKAGNYRWVAQVMNHVVFADPENKEARELEADALEQLGYQTESATWRNAYLFGAHELRNGVTKMNRQGAANDIVNNMPSDNLFDFFAIRLDPVKAAGKKSVINWHFTDTGEVLRLNLENATMTHVMGRPSPKPDASITLARTVLNAIISRTTTIPEAVQAGQIKLEGNAMKIAEIFGMLDQFELSFDILTPGPNRP